MLQFLQVNWETSQRDVVYDYSFSVYDCALQLTATCRIKLRLSLYFQIKTLNSSVFYRFLLTILYLPGASVAA